MGAEWISMRKDLREDPAVILICERFKLAEDTVIGKLHRFWSWADGQLVPDSNGNGNAPGVTILWLDRYVELDGFGKALVEVCWLDEMSDGIAIPNFSRWMSQSGKARLVNARRQSNFRKKSNANRNADRNGGGVTKALPTEQNRTEQVIKPPSESLSRSDKIDYKFFMESWNRVAAVHKHISPIAKINDTRRGKLRTRLKDKTWEEQFLTALTKLPLPSKIEDDWQPNFDWIIWNERNAQRVISGEFDWRATKSAPVGVESDRNLDEWLKGE